MKNITITIAGETASGKTTITLAIIKLLSDHGFTDVSTTDVDVMRDERDNEAEMQATRMEAIKNRSIAIQTLQLNKVRR